MARVGSGTGQGGKTMDERDTAKRVRNLALSEIEKILKRKKGKLYEAVIIKLAGSVLPRLNAGRDDDERLIPVPLFDFLSNVRKNNSDRKDTPDDGEDTGDTGRDERE